MKKKYKTVEKAAESFLIEKKSRFITLVQPIIEEKEATPTI
jgi:putative IMPACT (imprinted ancient) family translation regulator